MNKFTFLVMALFMQANAWADGSGAPVSYQLPATGPLPQTYTVTLAIVDAKNPDWIVSTFVAAAERTVTAENKGQFTETWNGLDENFMPVPPGKYGVKGIYMPAQQWKVDGEWHSITPQFVSGAQAWMPSAQQADKPAPFGGDPVGSPLRDVAVAPNGVAVFYYQYLENGLNNPMVDLKKPIGYGQFLRAFKSGGAGGGSSVATDGETVWAFSTDGGPKYVYRADEKPFGKSPGANRANGFLPDGWVTAMAASHDDATGKSFVYVAQRGKFINEVPESLTPAQRQKIAKRGNRRYEESDTDFANKVSVHAGEDGRVLAELPVERPRGLAVHHDALYALHAEVSGFAVSSVALASGVPGAAWQRVFAVPGSIQPADLAIDSHDHFYLSDSAANKVFQLDRSGKVLLTYGRLPAQVPGSYDPQSFIAPEKLAAWIDADGNDRVLVVEQGGPNRASEWSADGKLLREFLSLQTKANDGYTYDPDHPEMIYIAGQQGWLTRFKVDYERGSWTVDAVWPSVGTDPRSPKLDKPQFMRVNGQAYIACGRSNNVYRQEGNRWVLSAALLHERVDDKKWKFSFWHDANGNGQVDDDETTPTELPGSLMAYHGQNWLSDLSMIGMNQGGHDVWRMAPSGFDPHGNPIFKEWTKLFADPILEARLAGKADAIHGGNELEEKFGSWIQTDGSIDDGFYVQSRGAHGFTANEGAQFKISRYVPDGQGGFRIKWRVGRTALQHTALPGEMYGGMRIHRPLNGLISVVDQSRCGILLYTDDGLYVDTLFPDIRRVGKGVAGMYQLGGEFFAGSLFPNKDNGRIYFALGKYTPLFYEAKGWSLSDNPVHRLTEVQSQVSISAAQIAQPPEIALTLRGGSGAAKFARFWPALGEVAYDGSLIGWESAEPINFQADQDQAVEVRGLYQPDQLLLRWHARLATKFAPRPLPAIERIFTHDQQADTLSFYIQGDVNAQPGGPAEGRPGDVRFVFGIFEQDGKPQPVALGLYPEWTGAGSAHPQIYRTPVGQAAFAHAGPVAGAKLGYAIDPDGKGFVLVTSIPRAAIPRLQQSFAGGLNTLVNFEATFGGHGKFWWANRDGSASRETYDEPTEARLYPGSWAPLQLQGIEGGVVIHNWLIAGPFGGPGAEKLQRQKDAAHKFFEAATYPPDNAQCDPQAVFKGDMIRGYWPELREVRWKPAAIADLDQRVLLGTAAQVWYGATWIHVPADTELEFHFLGHLQTELRWYLNKQPVIGLKYQRKEGAMQAATQSLTLHAGWNHVQFRGYCIGYPPFRVGLVLDGPQDKLLSLTLAAKPPKQ